MEDNKTEKELFTGEVTNSKSDDISYDAAKELLAQIKLEYEYADDHLKPKRDIWLKRLKLYNNQKKNPKAIGDVSLYVVFQSTLASIYSDRLQVKFLGNEEGDNPEARHLNILAEYDYKKMRKSIMDYLWDWDTSFFGRGIVRFKRFDRDKKIPVPEVIDPFVFYRDPEASSINGMLDDEEACRFLGMDIEMTMHRLKQNPAYFNLDKIEKQEAQDPTSNKEEARRERAMAQGINDTAKKLKPNHVNYKHPLVEWYTHDKEGRKVLVTCTRDFQEMVRYQVLENQKTWELYDRPFSPMAHDWDGVSIPDLIEDSQRAKSTLSNIGLKAAKADLYPMYAFDEGRVDDNQNLDFAFNKWIPVQGPPGSAVMPLQKASPNLQLYNYIMQYLDQAQEKATATPEVKQGVSPDSQRTLGELNMVSSQSDQRYSLTAKIFGWSEHEFWYGWYMQYKTHFAANIDEKIVRLKGTYGDRPRKIARENIIATIDPDIEITSKVLEKTERQEKLNNFVLYLKALMSDPTSNRRYAMFKFGKLAGLDEEEIERLLPPTPDERIAREENEMLNDNKLPKIRPEDNHEVHIQEHMKANQTKATIAHQESHKAALRLKTTNPNIMPVDQEKGMETGQESNLVTNIEQGPPAQSQGSARNQAVMSQLL